MIRKARNPDLNTSSTKNVAIVFSALIFVVALNLRPAITAVGPIIHQIGEDYGLNEGLLGLLGALPLLAFAVFSPLVHLITRRIDIEHTILIALSLLAVASIIRSYTGPVGLWAGTLLMGITLAIGNVLVPVVVKKDYPKHISGATAIYSSCIAAGSVIASITAVPLATAIDWEFSLAFWAIPALVVSLLWALRIRHQSRIVQEQLPEIHLASTVWKQSLAWLITLFMGVQSANFFIFVTWLPTIEMSFGSSEELAAVHLFLYTTSTVVGGLSISQVLNRSKNQVLAAVIASVPMLIGISGIMLAPTLNILWVIISGLSSGASLVVALALVAMRGRSREETTQLSGMAQSVGYLIAAIGPAVAGLLKEYFGNWFPAMLFVLGIGILQVLIAFWAGQHRKEAPSATL